MGPFCICDFRFLIFDLRRQRLFVAPASSPAVAGASCPRSISSWTFVKPSCPWC